jgi:subtilisin family serine protease
MDAADRGFDVINMSLGGYGVYGGQGTNDLATFVAAEKRIANYVNQAGTVMVASAGNGAVNLNGRVIHTPGDVKGIINVAATGLWPSIFAPEYDVLTYYSNYGAAVDIAAPGGDLGPEGTPYPFPAVYHLVLSTYVIPNPACAATYSCPLGYAWAGGTSMAAPHVAGGAGLVRDANPDLNPLQVKSILTSTAERIGSRQLFGHGMLDVFAAVGKADR